MSRKDLTTLVDDFTDEELLELIPGPLSVELDDIALYYTLAWQKYDWNLIQRFLECSKNVVENSIMPRRRRIHFDANTCQETLGEAFNMYIQKEVFGYHYCFKIEHLTHTRPMIVTDFFPLISERVFNAHPELFEIYEYLYDQDFLSEIFEDLFTIPEKLRLTCDPGDSPDFISFNPIDLTFAFFEAKGTIQGNHTQIVNRLKVQLQNATLQIRNLNDRWQNVGTKRIGTILKVFKSREAKILFVDPPEETHEVPAEIVRRFIFMYVYTKYGLPVLLLILAIAENESIPKRSLIKVSNYFPVPLSMRFRGLYVKRSLIQWISNLRRGSLEPLYHKPLSKDKYYIDFRDGFVFDKRDLTNNSMS